MFNNQIIAGSSGQGGGSFYSYSIDQSLRFEESAAANLTFTPSNNGTDNKKFTYSVWVKLGQDSSDDRHIIQSQNTGGGTGQGHVGFRVSTSDRLDVYSENGGANPNGTRLLRDHSGWYHFCFVYDTTEATAADRIKVYINGDQDPSSSGSFPGLNSVTSSMNYNGQIQLIGKYVPGYTRYFNGYMAEIHMVDGQALAPTDFAEDVNGVWVPKEYTDNGTTSHGVNGYHLTFQGTGTATTTQGTTAQVNIGDDQSGNGNNWTANNLAASDVLPDSPTNNFCTWNTLDKYNYNAPSEGNLRALTAGNNGTQNSTFAVSSGKWYWEARNITAGSGSMVRFIGIAKEDTNISSTPYTNSDCYLYYAGNGNIYNGSNLGSYGDTWGADGDIVGVAFDADNGAIWFSKNGTWQNSATAAEIAVGTTTNAAFTGLSGTFVMMVSRTGGTSSNDPHHANFGQDSTFAGDATTGSANAADDNGIGDFFYAPPSGFLALCSANLDESDIGPNSAEQADDYFNTVLYTGNASTNAITGVGFSPDFVWIKNRSAAQAHNAFDTVRGAGELLYPNLTNAEATTSIHLNSFDSDGFTVGSATSANGSGNSIVAWNWKAGGTAVSNTDGSITSSVSAAPDAGFSIVGFTSTGNTETVGHGLSQAPELYIRKSRSNAENWVNFFTVVDGTLDFMNFNNTNAASGSGASLPTSTVFSIGGGETNGETHVCYCFHSSDVCKVGSYVGNGSSDGTFVYTGFRPAWVMTKRTNGTSWWGISDAARSTYNEIANTLAADQTYSESTLTSDLNLDFLSNGFKIRDTDGYYNASGGSYFYLAFAEAPFKYANAR